MTTTPAAQTSDGAAGPAPAWPEDERRLLERLGGDSAVLVTLAAYFLEDAAPLADAIRRDFAAGSFPTARRAAHTLRGMALNLACPRLVETTAALEAALDAQNHAAFVAVLPAWERALADNALAMRAYLARCGG